MNVEAILRSKGRQVATISPDATIAAAVQELTSRGIGALVVSGDGVEVEGIVSERDIVRGLTDHGADLLRRSVGELMTRRVYSCSPDDSVADLMAQMTERRVRHIPVLRDGALYGIISIGDVVKNRLDEVEFEANSLRSFIAGG
jgi:CBS domain-containing protein